jgi:superfamily II DNA or RNA helicase
MEKTTPSKIPWKWQIAAVARFGMEKIMSIVADCGTGKTFAAIMIALAKMMPVIVIAPGHMLCEQWRDDIKDVLGDDADVWVYSKPEETKQGEYYKERFEKWLTT